MKKFNNNNKFKNNKDNFFKKKKNNNNFFKTGKFKFVKKFSNINSKIFRVYDSIANRRSRLLKRLHKLNNKIYLIIISRYPNFKWLKDNRLIWGLNKYRKFIYALESQGLKRKIPKKRLKIYGLALIDKQKLKNYYYFMKEYSLKNIVSQVFFHKYNHLTIFATLLESRLISFLQRTRFFKTPNQLKIFIKLGYILINDKVVKDLNVFLKIGDTVSFNFKKNYNFFFKIGFLESLKKKLSLYYYPSRFMEVSFSSLVFMFYKRPKISQIPYPFTINLSRILYYYNYRGLR